MFDYDRSNFMRYLTDFPRQSREALNASSEAAIPVDTRKLRNIVLAGMGGSGIAADLFLDYTADELAYPVQLVREYALPGYADDYTLVICLSYSGDTEEVLSVMKEAQSRGCQVIGVASGGGLQSLCTEHGKPFLSLPAGLPPRQALGHMFFSLLGIFARAGFVALDDDVVQETVLLLQDLCERYSPNRSMGNNLANHIAQSIYKAIPIIYSGVPFLRAVPVRWRNQFNENSKAMAFSNVFPELNHNEVTGWEGPPEINSHLRVILLRDPEESDRLQQRIRISKSIMKQNNILFGEVFSEGESRLARMFSLIYVGDWASYYLAMLYEKDPIEINSIQYLKEQLSGLEKEM